MKIRCLVLSIVSINILCLVLSIVSISFNVEQLEAFSLKANGNGCGKNGPTNKPAYVVIEAKLKSSELQRFASYASKVPSLVKKYSGEYLILGGDHEPLEGDWGETRIVLHKWESTAQAKEFWNSDEYQELKKLREGTGDFRIMLVEGLEKEDVL